MVDAPATSHNGSEQSALVDFFYCPQCTYPRPVGTDGVCVCVCSDAMGSDTTLFDPFEDKYRDADVICMAGHHPVPFGKLVSACQTSRLPYCAEHAPRDPEPFFCETCDFLRPAVARYIDEKGNPTPVCAYCNIAPDHDESDPAKRRWAIGREYAPALCRSNVLPTHEVSEDCIVAIAQPSSSSHADPKLLQEGASNDLRCICMDCIEDLYLKGDSDDQSDSADSLEQVPDEAFAGLADQIRSLSMQSATEVTHDLSGFPEDFKNKAMLSRGYPATAGNIDMDRVVQEFRGRDNPKAFLVKNDIGRKQGGRKGAASKPVIVNNPAPAVVTFGNGTMHDAFGTIGGKGKPPFDVTYIDNTQTPHIRLRLPNVNRGPDKTQVEAFIYSNSLEMCCDPEDHASLACLSMQVGPDVAAQDLSDDAYNDESTGIPAALAADELWYTQAIINSSRPTGPPEQQQSGLSASRFSVLPEDTDMSGNDVPPHQPKAIQPMSTETRSKVKFSGVSAQDLERIFEGAQDTERWLKFSDAEKIVWWLSQPYYEMHIYTRIASASIDAAKGFVGFFRAIMKMSLDHGSYWFYRLEANSTKKFSAREFPIKDLPVPRWMVNSWRVSYTKDNVAIPGTEQAVGWTNFRVPVVASSPDDQMFQYLLGIMREREQHQRLIEGSRITSEKRIVVKFMNFQGGHSGRFLAKMFLEGYDPMLTPTKLPAFDSRITIEVTIGNKNVTLVGATCEDYFKTGSHIIACLRIVGANIKPEEIQEDTDYHGQIGLIEDEIPTSRMIRGLRACSTPKKSNKGVDVGFLLGFTEPKVTDPGCLDKEYGKTPSMRKAFSEVLDRMTLDQYQKKAAESITRSPTGVTALWGPPGTGKTTTNVAMAEGLAQGGKTVAYVVPSNAARDVALRSFLKVTRLRPDQIVRYTGAFQGGPPAIDEEGPEQHAQEVQDDLNDLWELYQQRETTSGGDDLTRYGFSQQLDNFIMSAASNPAANPEVHKKAKEYLQKKTEYSEAKSKGIDKKLIKSLRKDLARLQATLTEDYFKNRVRIFFLTESQCAADPIYMHAKVQCILLDEAGMSTIPGLAVPLGVFKETLEALILSGDHRQQPPTVVSKLTNEFGNLLTNSLIQQLYERDDPRIYMLRNSYRLVAEIGDWNSRRFYNGRLNSMNPGDAKLYSTMNAAIATNAPFFVAKHRLSRRFAVDVSDNDLNHREVFSDSMNSRSQVNDFEAEFLVRFVVGLLQFRVTDDTTQCTILPSDFMIITPYSGQRSLIKMKLANAHRQGIRGQDNATLLSIPVLTTAASQAGEGKIVLISLVANHPGEPKKLGFITNPTQLNVETSRAREFLVFFGNFKGWCNLIRGRDQMFVNANNQGKLGDFINLINELYHRNQIIDCDDVCESLEGTMVQDSTFVSTLAPQKPQEDEDNKKRKVGPDTNLPKHAGGKFAQVDLVSAAAPVDEQPAKKKKKKNNRGGKKTGQGGGQGSGQGGGQGGQGD
ncbi:putative dna-binding protein smubp-2 [Diplodia seriata]|uniref:Putative dna-binding protein smubp-2 n=1 Tax=Diplodia seriata TaxID=420778 RepID=A0A0G2EEC5_9PEZI|nr:putative dna-binding protein smubp-2 [Diplodia seriata]